MSINWVMLSDGGFTPLPGEQHLYTSPPRTGLSIQSLGRSPSQEPFSVQSSSGCVHLTNRRMIYLPASPTPQLQSFAAPILNLHDTHVATPWFGPNVWQAILQPVPGGGIPPQHAALELKMTFKDGGAYDFHTLYERIKERLQQAVEVARESGQIAGDGVERGGAAGAGALAGVDLGMVHLDQLPAYEEAPSGPASSAQPRDSGIGTSPGVNGDCQRSPTSPTSPLRSPQAQTFSTPTEPPPGYEEVQRNSVADELERRLRARDA